MSQPSALRCSRCASSFRVNLHLRLGLAYTTGSLGRTQRSVLTARHLRLRRPVTITCLSTGAERSSCRVCSGNLSLSSSSVLASLCTCHRFTVLHRSLGLREGIVVVTDLLNVCRITSSLSSLSYTALGYRTWILVYRGWTLTWTVSRLLACSDSTRSYATGLSSQSSLLSSSWVVLTSSCTR